MSDLNNNAKGYEYVQHPSHYNNYYLEVIDILERIYGTEYTAMWCEMTAMKYRLRMGTKPGEPIERDLEKERWYLDKRNELNAKLAKEEETSSDDFDVKANDALSELEKQLHADINIPKEIIKE